MFLNLNRCNFSDSGCEKFSGEFFLLLLVFAFAKNSVILCPVYIWLLSHATFSDLINLKILNLGMNNITNSCLVHLRGCLTLLYIFVCLFHLCLPVSEKWHTHSGLTKLESLNLDSCRIGDEGLVHLSGDCYLRFLLFITDFSVFKNITLVWF